MLHLWHKQMTSWTMNPLWCVCHFLLFSESNQLIDMRMKCLLNLITPATFLCATSVASNAPFSPSFSIEFIFMVFHAIEKSLIRFILDCGRSTTKKLNKKRRTTKWQTVDMWSEKFWNKLQLTERETFTKINKILNFICKQESANKYKILLTSNAVRQLEIRFYVKILGISVCICVNVELCSKYICYFVCNQKQ